VVAALLVISIAVVFFTVSQQNSAFTDQIISGEINRAFTNLKADMSELNTSASNYASVLSSDIVLVNLVKSNNYLGTKELIENYNKSMGLDYITIVNGNGDVFLRLDAPDKQGESLSGDANITKALSGMKTNWLQYDAERNITCQSAMPLISKDGTAGAIITGFSYGDEKLLDDLKTVHGVDFTIFANDVRWVTTIMDKGKRVVGTKLTRR
jgi:methyl-accepting chemotaxis protein